MKVKLFLIIVMFISIGVLGYFFAKSEPAPIAQSVQINFGSDPQTIDPRKARALNDICLLNMLFEGLTRMGKNGEIQLSLAEEHLVSPDKKRHTFILKETYWSDKTRVTADDFVYCWQTILSPSFPAPMAFQLYLIKNAKKIKEGDLSIETLGVFAFDEKTLIIELEYPVNNLYERLAFPCFFPVNKKIDLAQEMGQSNLKTIISNGPFCIKTWKHHDSIELEKNKKYWDKDNVLLQSIKIFMLSPEAESALFEAGKIDWIGSPFSYIPTDLLSQLIKEDRLQTHDFLGTAFLRVNVDKIKQNQRNSLSKTIQRKKIVKHILQCDQKPTHVLVPPQMLQTEILEIKEPLETFEGTTIQLMYKKSEENHLIVQTMQKNWKEKLGINVKLFPAEKNLYFEKLRNQDYEVALCAWFADINDPMNFLGIFVKRDNGINNTGWDNALYSDLLEESYQFIGEKKERLLKKAQELLLKEKPIIPIYHMVMRYMKNPALKNVGLNSLGHVDFKWAYKEKK